MVNARKTIAANESESNPSAKGFNGEAPLTTNFRHFLLQFQASGQLRLKYLSSASSLHDDAKLLLHNKNEESKGREDNLA